MTWLDTYRTRLGLVGLVVGIVLSSGYTKTGSVVAADPLGGEARDVLPVADAGLSRYAAVDPVQLDGTRSYGPNDNGALSYRWQQISGPTIRMVKGETATPTIQGFVQTDYIQECYFELTVFTEELESEPDIVKVVIVPTFVPGTKMLLENDAFDPDKPTFIWFGGAYSASNLCTGGALWNFYEENWKTNELWKEKANIISFSPYFADPNSACGWHSGPSMYFSRCADPIIAYLSDVAPDYCQPIQTAGGSLGAIPAIDVALRLNKTYADARYAVNHVSFLDENDAVLDPPECRARVADFLANPVDGEQCWLDSYESRYGGTYSNAMNVYFTTRNHWLAPDWYHASLLASDSSYFNGGVVAGAYWSVAGPGKNLQLASTPGVQTYKYLWSGNASTGQMNFFNGARLPKPVTLLEPLDVGDPDGLVLACEESENAVGYELLLGPDPYRVRNYDVISDTPIPPTDVITALPFDETWWTVRVRDQYGSTIYADPVRIDSLSRPIENLNTGMTYQRIQFAIDDASPGDELVVDAGLYLETIDFKGKNLIVRSINPNDSATVAATIVNGDNLGSAVTFSGSEDASCMLAGFTITGGKSSNGGGIYCKDGSSPTIANCTITNNSATQSGGGICTVGSQPTVLNCTFSGNSAAFVGGGMYNSNNSSSPVVTNCTFSGNSAGFLTGGLYCAGGSTTLTNCILWGNTPGEVSVLGGTLIITYSDIEGGFEGVGNIDVDPLFVDTDNANYHLKSQAGRWDPISQDWILDDVTSSCIDAGDPVALVALEALPNGGIVNMGAYGGTTEASKASGN